MSTQDREKAEAMGLRVCTTAKWCATCEAMQQMRAACCEFCGGMSFEELYEPDPDYKPKKRRQG